METKNIYIIRHGETEYNKLGMVQGSGIDSNLNDFGRAQAKAFYEHFFNVPFDKVYTSRLKRTHQSVKGFIEELQLPWQQLFGLNEVSWGNKEGRILTDDDDQSYFQMIEGWRQGNVHLKAIDGESPIEVQARQRIAWKYIMANTQEKNILVCMHGRAIRILMCLLLDVSLSDMDCFKHQNMGLYQLQFNNGKYTLAQSNYAGHLNELNQKQQEEVFAK